MRAPAGAYPVLKCTDERIFCLTGGDPNSIQEFQKIILDQTTLENARVKARDAKRRADLMVLLTASAIKQSSNPDKEYLKLEGALWTDLLNSLSVTGIVPPQSDKFASNYCYYVNNAQDTIILSTRFEGQKKQTETATSLFINPVHFEKETFFLTSSSPLDKSDCVKPADGAVLECDKDTIFCLATGNADVLTRITQ